MSIMSRGLMESENQPEHNVMPNIYAHGAFGLQQFGVFGFTGRGTIQKDAVVTVTKRDEALRIAERMAGKWNQMYTVLPV